MPQSLSNVLIHLVFSTKDRTPSLTPEIGAELHPYLVGALANLGCPSIQTGGTADRVHTLFRLSRTIALAKVVQEVKTTSSKWVKDKWPHRAGFAWQAGYGAFSIGQREAPTIVRYIQNQEEHHRTVSFQEEFRALLAESGVEFDERYVWD
jgi:REP element-mobilizing transposase RayT